MIPIKIKLGQIPLKFWNGQVLSITQNLKARKDNISEFEFIKILKILQISM